MREIAKSIPKESRIMANNINPVCWKERNKGNEIRMKKMMKMDGLITIGSFIYHLRERMESKRG